MQKFVDKFHRTIDYLRISITDKCNLRCIYCMPEEGIKLYNHEEILSYEEITRIVKVAVGLGVKKIRITGGEPLVKKDLSFLISSLNSIVGVVDISMTTNGTLLKRFAKELFDAGLKRVNVSLDTFKPDRYKQITRGGNIDDVFAGIDEAEKVGLRPIKINMVPIRGINDDEIESFARLTMHKDWQVRFIEFMPFGSRDVWTPERYISTDEIKQRISDIAPIKPLKLRSSGPARYYKFDDANGVIGRL
ncbi:MAG: GTP 3',8-cyclase MoaA, partial [Thermodesulfovibrionales bacterium]